MLLMLTTTTPHTKPGRHDRWAAEAAPGAFSYRDGAGPTTDDPGAFLRSISEPSVLSDLDLGADWLTSQSWGHKRKVGVVGVCMGGTFTLLAASTSDRFSAAAPFYGILSYDRGMLAAIGRRAGVASIYGRSFSGLIAWFLWLVVHITSLIGFRNRLVVLFEWAWAYFTYQRSARVILSREK